MTIGSIIRQARQKAGLKQSTLSAQVGLRSESFINQIERGKQVPSFDMAQRIEKALGLPLNSLALLVFKYRLQQLTAMLLHEANERGINVKVRVGFND